MRGPDVPSNVPTPEGGDEHEQTLQELERDKAQDQARGWPVHLFEVTIRGEGGLTPEDTEMYRVVAKKRQITSELLKAYTDKFFDTDGGKRIDISQGRHKFREYIVNLANPIIMRNERKK